MRTGCTAVDQSGMDRRVLWMSIAVGSTAGGFVPMLFGAGSLSMASLLGSVVGTIVGVWVAIRIDAAL
jgi:IS1 family transposase